MANGLIEACFPTYEDRDGSVLSVCRNEYFIMINLHFTSQPCRANTCHDTATPKIYCFSSCEMQLSAYFYFQESTFFNNDVQILEVFQQTNTCLVSIKKPMKVNPIT